MKPNSGVSIIKTQKTPYVTIVSPTKTTTSPYPKVVVDEKGENN